MGVCHSKAIEEAGSCQAAPVGGVGIGSAAASNQGRAVVVDRTNSHSSEGGSVPSPGLEKAERQGTTHSRLRAEIERRRANGDLKTNIVHIEDPSGRPIEDVYDGVHTGDQLGEGVTGVVRLVTHRDTGVEYAVKCLDLKHLKTEGGLQQICEEICIMCELDHPNIARLEEVYESRSKIYLVQELCHGRELLDRLDEQPEFFTEEECVRLVKEILRSVRYLHSKGIIHRDLKLENFVFASKDPESELKMIDFGLSKHFSSGEIQHEAAGTPYTVAPEIIQGSYDEKSDVWAVGVIAYLLLSGYPPFGSCDIESCLGGCNNRGCLQIVRSNILCGSFSFDPEEVWSDKSPQARDFVRTLLVTNPNARPTAEGAQGHEWLRCQDQQQDIEVRENKLDPNVVGALVEFKNYSESERLLREVLSFAILPEQTKHLRKEFKKLDMDDMGEVSLTALKCALREKRITEQEIECIFNSMRISKAETRIHWHEFIAAGLSQCQVDNRNLKLLFERVDQEHKGYITFDDCIKMLGKDAGQHIDAMKRMWGGSECGLRHERITYADLLRIAPRAQ